MSAESRRLLLVDDHPIVCDGWAALLQTLPVPITVHRAHNAAQAMAAARACAPLALVLLDQNLPDANGQSLLPPLRRLNPDAALLIVTAEATLDQARAALAAGADGLLLKTLPGPDILQAVYHLLFSPPSVRTPWVNLGSGRVDFCSSDTPVRPGAPRLSPRQHEILLRIEQGLSNRDIATALGLSEKTVKNHISTVFITLQAANRLQALRQARSLGLL